MFAEDYYDSLRAELLDSMKQCSYKKDSRDALIYSLYARFKALQELNKTDDELIAHLNKEYVPFIKSLHRKAVLINYSFFSLVLWILVILAVLSFVAVLISIL